MDSIYLFVKEHVSKENGFDITFLELLLMLFRKYQ